MEEDEIQAQVSKFPRVGNIGSKIASRGNNDNNDEQYPEEEEDGELELMKRRGGGGGSDGSTNRFHHHNSTSSWNNHSSRIIRVSRASGGKDRHSKVMTSKGLRDRRVRLSVATAIQFYDLQDRLGYDQPSKAVEWLIKAASDAISELPSFNNTFPETPRQPSDERRPGAVGAEREQHGLFDEVDGDTNNYPQQNQSHNLSLSKSACSSTSETSKGSGLSLSRSEMRVNRVKARERARERSAKEKENESRININNNANYHHHRNVNNNNSNSNPMSQNASFTELLTGGIGNNSTITVPNTTNSPTGSVHQIHHGGDEVNLFNKETITTTTRQQQQQQQQQQQHWSSTVTPIMDYFSPGLLVGPPSSSRTNHHQSSSSDFSGQIQLGTSLPVTPFSGENHSDQMQQFSFMNDHLIMPAAAAAVVTSSSTSSHHQHHCGGDYGLNFSISSSSGLAGYNNNRGTLQSNSHHNHPSLLPHHHHLQRFISPMDGSSSNVPFSIGGVSQASATPPTMDNNNNHHQFFSVFDGRLQLYYGDGSRHSADQKGKGKN